MGNPTCPSCGHEIYEKGTGTCQFCGQPLDSRVVKQVSVGGANRRAARMAISLGILVLMAVGGLVSFLAAQESEMAAKESASVVPTTVPEPVSDQPTGHEVCYEWLRTVLEAELEFQRGIDNGTLTKEELDRLDAQTEGYCPETERPYRVDVIGNSVTVTCPDHGSLSGDW